MNKFIIFLLLLTTMLQAQNKDVTLLLSWKHQFQFAGYYVAKEMGFYEKVGLNVDIKEYDLKRDNTKDISTQKSEFSIGHSSLILDKLNDYPNIVVLTAVHQSSPLILLSKKRTDITSLKDIAGKKIMMSYDQTSTASINAMLSSEHLEKNSYQVIETSFNPIDLINGNADLMMSYSSNEPFTLKEKGIDYTIFDPKDYGFDFYSDMLFTSSQMIENNPDDVKAFYIATIQGWKYAYEHIDESVEIILKHYNTQSRSKKALIFEAQILKKLAFKDGVAFGTIEYRRLREMVNTYRLLGLVDKNTKVDLSSFIYQDFGDSNLTDFHLKNLNNKKFSYNIMENEYLRIFAVTLIMLFLIGLFFKKRADRTIALKSAQLEKQNEIFNKNISSSRTDIDGKITYVSKAFCEKSGYNEDELLGVSHSILKDKDTSDNIYKDLWLTISSGHTWTGELKNIKKDGTPCWLNCVISPIFDKNNKIIAYESIAEDLTLEKVLIEFNEKLNNEVKERTIELEKLAITDKLTNMYNRVKLDKELSYNHENFLRYERTYSIIIIDIDFFKNINDSYGHQVGDEILQEVSAIMKSQIRATDIIGRWGGEEFMIISPNTDIDGAYALAEHIRIKINETQFETVKELTISAGIAQSDVSLKEDALIKKADDALYRAKKNGRNRVEK